MYNKDSCFLSFGETCKPPHFSVSNFVTLMRQGNWLLQRCNLVASHTFNNAGVCNAEPSIFNLTHSHHCIIIRAGVMLKYNSPPPPLDSSGRVGKSWFVNFLITCMSNWKNIIVETSHWKDCSSNALIVINYTRNIIIRNSWKVWTIIVVCSPICHCLCVVLVLFI